MDLKWFNYKNAMSMSGNIKSVQILGFIKKWEKSEFRNLIYPKKDFLNEVKKNISLDIWPKPNNLDIWPKNEVTKIISFGYMTKIQFLQLSVILNLIVI